MEMLIYKHLQIISFFSHLRVEVKEAVVLESQEESVVFLDALFHQRARRIQPPEDNILVTINKQLFCT